MMAGFIEGRRSSEYPERPPPTHGEPSQFQVAAAFSFYREAALRRATNPNRNPTDKLVLMAGETAAGDAAPPPLSVLVIGAGQRGYAYSEAIRSKALASRCIVAAVAEPDEAKRLHFAKTFNVRDEAVYADWKEVVDQADAGTRLPVDGVLICTLDWQHAEPAIAFARLGYHVMLEKPLSTTWSSTLDILNAFRETHRLFSVGHVLRYSPFYLLLKRLVTEEGVVGQLRHVQHTERVGWWHFAHSYVRGNWRNSGLDADGNETGLGAPSLLAKCCHDTDLLFWLLDGRPLTHVQSTVNGSQARPKTTQHRNAYLADKNIIATAPDGNGKGLKTDFTPLTVYSTSSLALFTNENKPPNAGKYCLDCPLEPTCLYSAKRIYLDHALRNPTRGSKWPASVLVPDIEDLPDIASREAAILSALSPTRKLSEGENHYGRCVWDVPDNDVAENQTVLYTFPGGVIATLNMVATAGAISKRDLVLYGTLGEMHADGQLKTITVHTYADDTIRMYQPDSTSPGGVGDAHSGGDFGLSKAFVDAMWQVEREGHPVNDVQADILGLDCEDLERAYKGVWAAEWSRKRKMEVRWNDDG